MKYCTYCGSPMEPSAGFCPNCGAKASDHTDSASGSDSVFGSATPYTDTRDYTENTGILVLSLLIPILGLVFYFLWHQTKPGKATSSLKGLLIRLCLIVPIVGIVLYFAWKEEKPDYARISGISGIVSIVLSVVMSILAFVIYFVIVFAAIGAAGVMYDDPYTYSELLRYALSVI